MKAAVPLPKKLLGFHGLTAAVSTAADAEIQKKTNISDLLGRG